MTDRSGEFVSLDRDRMPLDEKLYRLSEDDVAFLKLHTGIRDDDELKQHVLEVQADAYQVGMETGDYHEHVTHTIVFVKVYPYPCIRYFMFTHTGIARHFAYGQFLNLGRERPDEIFLELPVHAVSDGFPQQNCVAADLERKYWELGHRLFKSTPESFPVAFVPGDIFDQDYLASSVQPVYAQPNSPAPALSGLASLTPLRGHPALPLPGSMIFGRHHSADVKGVRDFPVPDGDKTSNVIQVFCHSPQTWMVLWNGKVFKEGTVEVKVELQEEPVSAMAPPERKLYVMVWSVTRL
ncbi:uncharacterized protein B0H18DRAFT_1117668 [Fomitopsis serialis]|uniref:uncharacterized protein n=1 Tax=Fomitopsis serialis TaxID=139415 RepID=UPI002008EA1D|nr:uncharacterized protein B0H18DRAFT_1117668 [Neoantrodia serialis]KAH9928838.1 hypothetical protein B0H18DRAFT_1117668 [Neoantrodia serialis]